MDTETRMIPNPNVWTEPRPIPRGIRAAQIVLAILLSLLCVPSTVTALSCLFAQNALSPSLLYRCAAEMDPTGIVVAQDENGTPFTIGEAVIACFDSLGVSVTKEEAAEMLDRLATPALLTAMAQDARRYFPSGQIPSWTEEEIADYMLAAMDDGMYQFLSYLGDPYELTVYLFARAVSLIPIERICAYFAPYRPLFSEPLLVCAISCAVVPLCLIFLLGKGMTVLRFVFLADCVSFLGLTYFCGTIQHSLFGTERLPFLEAVLGGAIREFRLDALIAATVFLGVFIVSLLRYVHHRALLRAKAQESVH